jgi:predicted FMN-binding regulatory protein PaiB
VELTIATVEAKYKLSQNRDADDQAGALEGLRGEPGPGPAAIAGLMAERMAERVPEPAADQGPDRAPGGAARS